MSPPTQTFPEDNSLMELDKTLVRSDDHDATIKKDYADVDRARHQTREHIPIPNIVHSRNVSKDLKVMNLHMINLVLVMINLCWWRCRQQN